MASTNESFVNYLGDIVPTGSAALVFTLVNDCYREFSLSYCFSYVFRVKLIGLTVEDQIDFKLKSFVETGDSILMKDSLGVDLVDILHRLCVYFSSS